MKKGILIALLFISAAGSVTICVAKRDHTETTIIRTSAMPMLDDEEEMSEHEAAVAAVVEVEDQSRVWQLMNKVGCQMLAACIHSKRAIMRYVWRFYCVCVGPKRVKKVTHK